jgi:hypothetical protein
LTGRDQVLNTLLDLTALSRANPGKKPSDRFITSPVQHVQVASLRSPEAKSNCVASVENRLGINSLPASTLLKFNDDLNREFRIAGLGGMKERTCSSRNDAEHQRGADDAENSHRVHL